MGIAIRACLAGMTLLAWGALASEVYAQKGMGEKSGMARKAVKPEIVSLSGEVLEVHTGPCKMTTGRARLGTHFMLRMPEGTPLNIHLGPAVAVDFAAEKLSVGAKVTVNAFRTKKMPKNHFVAQSLELNGATLQLRDENLRPVWAARRGAAPNQPRYPWTRGR